VSFFLTFLAAALYSVSSAVLSRSLAGGQSAQDNRHSGHSKPDMAGSGNFNPGSSNANSGESDFASAIESTASDTQPKSSFHRYRHIFLGSAAAGLVVHGWVVIQQTGLPHGLSLPLLTSITATTLTIVLLHIILCLKQPADYLGLAVYPLAAVSLIASEAAGGGAEIAGDAVQIHVFLSLLAYAMLALAAAQAVLVAIQRHFLATHKPGGFVRALPALDTTEHLLFVLLSIGFILLSLALASGFFYLEDMFSQRLVHKTVLSCVGWAIFGVLLFGRLQFGWRGRKAVYWTLGGYGILILAYFGTKVVLEILLHS